ncbi:hypothetical protein CTI12_AA008020 [Artemisia annua]|uniref:Reverse transcriptase domain-containing protein n=1 Tax=Artemisia annua TaxID=35608 RepID=A0A2U1QN35_ARTAN|nr:hypothetical protein CTI12_AA008020 [Artemisia annua]
MGFGDVWCSWVRVCITTYELEFMVNGDSVGVIKPQRGLRQGYPISPIYDSLLFLKASHVDCTALVRILNSYCEASGQTVNFQKSSAFVSPNTPRSLRDDICSTLKVQQMDSKTKYLGLPLIFGQKKTEMFGFLLDKVFQKMQGWKQKLLSQSGRDV